MGSCVESAAGTVPASTGLAHLRAVLAGKSLLIYDDGLRSVDGHWYEYDRSVVAIHRQLGVRTTIVCHRDFDHAAELRSERAEVRPVLQRSVWAGDFSGGGIVREFSTLVRLVGVTWRAVRAARPGDYDCVLVPNALNHDALAWCLTMTGGRRPRVALLFRFGLAAFESRGPGRFARKLAVWRLIGACLRRSARKRSIAVLTDSGRLAAEYRHVARVEPIIVPSPRIIQPVAAGAPEMATDPLFATLGAARHDKGIDLFQQAIRTLLTSGGAARARFLLQWNRPVLLASGATYPRDALLTGSERVTFLDDALSSAAYDALFTTIGCMVLPYRRSIYHSQISGVAIEAACAGIPIIYTADTWLADFVEDQGAGIAVPDGDAAALTLAIIRMTVEWKTFAAAARDRSVVARARNSPERFIRLLWGLGAASGAAAG